MKNKFINFIQTYLDKEKLGFLDDSDNNFIVECLNNEFKDYKMVSMYIVRSLNKRPWKPSLIELFISNLRKYSFEEAYNKTFTSANLVKYSQFYNG